MVGCSASVLANMAVVNALYDQHASSSAQHGGRDAGARVQLLALEAPGDCDGRVAF